MADTLKCDMTKECGATVTYIDEKGFVYCHDHGNDRKSHCRCRQLTKAEHKRMVQGNALRDY